MEWWEIEYNCPLLRRVEDENQCDVCGEPEGEIFTIEKFPNTSLTDDVFICQKCAPAFVDKYKEDQEEFAEAFKEACKKLEKKTSN